MNPRTFLIGAITGILLAVGTLVFVSAIAGVKWQPVSIKAA